MAFENLDFSGWKSGNNALARSKVDSETTRAKAHASQASGFTAGIGTVIGAIFGGPTGAAIGRSIGGSLSGNGDVDTVSGTEFAGMVDDWMGDRSATKKKKNVFGQGSNNEGDIMQLASSYNMIDENGGVKPTFLQFLDDIGYAG